MQYADIHLSHVAQYVWFGFLWRAWMWRVVEVAGMLEDGSLVPSTSIGNNKTWLDQADKIILEVNSRPEPGAAKACTTSTTARRCRRTASRSP